MGLTINAVCETYRIMEKTAIFWIISRKSYDVLIALEDQFKNLVYFTYNHGRI